MRVYVVLAKYVKSELSKGDLDFSTESKPIGVFEKEKDADKFCTIGHNKRNGWQYTVYGMNVVPAVDENLDRIKIELPPDSDETLIPNGGDND